MFFCWQHFDRSCLVMWECGDLSSTHFVVYDKLLLHDPDATGLCNICEH